MVDPMQVAQGRWSQAVIPLPPRTMAFLQSQVGPGQPRVHPVMRPVIKVNPPEGCPIALEPIVWGSVGMAWSDIDRAGQQPMNICGVASPASSAEVAEVLAWARAQDVAIIPRGGGTSVVGGLDALQPGLLLDMNGMSRILDFHATDALIHVQAGITGPVLERWLAERGFTFGHFPQSWERASLGGYAVTQSSGQASAGFGRFRDNVTDMSLVTPQGPWGIGRIPASAVGPDFIGIVSASEGTLGVLTDLQLRVRHLPEHVRAEGALLPDWERAVQAARLLTQAGLAPHVLRLSDVSETRATWAMSVPGGVRGSLAQAYCRVRGVRDGCLVIMQWQGGAELAARRRAAWRVLRKLGGVHIGNGVGQRWVDHRFAGPHLRDTLVDHGYFVETFETATRWSNIAQLHEVVRQTMSEELPEAYTMAHISHVYATGSSLYFTVIGAASIGERWPDTKAAVTLAITANGGTASHHHGVGTLHAPWLLEEIGTQGMAVWSAVKHACDPTNIMNPTVWNAWEHPAAR